MEDIADEFKKWVMANYSLNFADDVYNYAMKYAECLWSGNLAPIAMLNGSKRNHVLCALSALSKFLGIHDEFKALVKNHGLKWSKGSKDELIIARLTKVKSPNEIFEWVRDVKSKRPELSAFMDFVVITGLRLSEAIMSYNLIVKLKREGRLSDYYNEKMGTLEHFRYKDIFIRRNKKVFISFIIPEIIERINDELMMNKIVPRIKRAGMPERFADVREAYASYAIKHLEQPEVDFVQGRVSASVFMQHYFNPALIADLKERALKVAEELLAKVA